MGPPGATLLRALVAATALHATAFQDPVAQPLFSHALHAPHEVSSLMQMQTLQASKSDDSKKRQAETDALLQHDTATEEASRPKDAGWFGNFDQMESTYDVGGVDVGTSEYSAKNGIEVGFTVPKIRHPSEKARWFHESPSSGGALAWQSHYPDVPGSIAGNRNVRNNPWENTPGGWVQEYLPSQYTDGDRNPDDIVGKKGADWFDSSVDQLDGYGRQRLPDVGDPRRLLDTGGVGERWVERAVNQTIQCKETGCTAKATAFVFDPQKEEAQNCLLTVGLHATDFDGDFSLESVHSWLVNNNTVVGRCDPMARGCNETAWRPLQPCIRDYSIDHLMQTGSVTVQGTLTQFVDECPYEGNLLSGVVIVACMVRPIPPPPPTTTTTTFGVLIAPPRFTRNGTFACDTPGCLATLQLDVARGVDIRGYTCIMNITVMQTDFDSVEEAFPETLNISLSGAGRILTDAKPGENPCNSEYAGTPLPKQKMSFLAVDSRNVTEEVNIVPVGLLDIVSRISKHVDECATKDGNLLEGFVNVFCEGPSEVITATGSNGSEAPSEAVAETASNTSEAL